MAWLLYSPFSAEGLDAKSFVLVSCCLYCVSFLGMSSYCLVCVMIVIIMINSNFPVSLQ